MLSQPTKSNINVTISCILRKCNPDITKKESAPLCELLKNLLDLLDYIGEFKRQINASVNFKLAESECGNGVKLAVDKLDEIVLLHGNSAVRIIVAIWHYLGISVFNGNVENSRLALLIVVIDIGCGNVRHTEVDS